MAAANDGAETRLQALREPIAKALADRFIERGNARVTGSVHASWNEVPGSYRNDFLTDADAVIRIFTAAHSVG